MPKLNLPKIAPTLEEQFHHLEKARAELKEQLKGEMKPERLEYHLISDAADYINGETVGEEDAMFSFVTQSQGFRLVLSPNQAKQIAVELLERVSPELRLVEVAEDPTPKEDDDGLDEVKDTKSKSKKRKKPKGNITKLPKVERERAPDLG